MTQQEHFNGLCNSPSDINEHLSTLKEYTSKVNHVTEMGVRGVTSTFAFLMGKPKTLISIDIQHPSKFPGGQANLDLVKQYADESGVDFMFQLGDTTKVNIDPTDFLFIDTWHAYKQLKKELALHHSKVSKYIGFHDTTSFATTDESSYEVWGDDWKGEGIGLWRAIEEFLAEHPEWQIDIRKTNNNGLTILKRV